jgi:hypothetical protein
MSGTAAVACPDGYSEGWPGICYPNVGGTVGEAWEKAKDELANFESDARTWLETGVCGGDICDVFAAAIEFAEAEIVDAFDSLSNAGDRLSEGKPLDAVWHLTTDSLRNTDDNAAQAAKRSRVLQATGQVAAGVYGGPAGAAAYTAWLTYHATCDAGHCSVADALKAGVISGATQVALGSINDIDIGGAEGIAARAALTGAVNGAAVAAAGGNQDQIRAAVGLGVTAVLIREGYREFTDLNLDEQRLRSSTGEAYCLKELVTEDYIKGGDGLSCFAPRDTYIRQDDGRYRFDPGKSDLLDPDRPHVGIFAEAENPWYNIAAENSRVMTGVSRLPGWNAMALAHDRLAINTELGILGIDTATSVGTIAPAVVVTYAGTGYGIHEMVREVAVKQAEERNLPDGSQDEGNDSQNNARDVDFFNSIEMTHAICGTKIAESNELNERTDLEIVTSVSGQFADRPGHRVCEIRQKAAGTWYELYHAHYEVNYCHRVAERIIKRRQRLGSACYGSVGLLARKLQSSSETVANSGQ